MMKSQGNWSRLFKGVQVITCRYAKGKQQSGGQNLSCMHCRWQRCNGLKLQQGRFRKVSGKASHNKAESLKAIAWGGDGISFIGSFLEQDGQTFLSTIAALDTSFQLCLYYYSDCSLALPSSDSLKMFHFCCLNTLITFTATLDFCY